MIIHVQNKRKETTYEKDIYAASNEDCQYTDITDDSRFDWYWRERKQCQRSGVAASRQLGL